jgi:DNA-directed RNA polymerase subunit RPC12/RpoP
VATSSEPRLARSSYTVVVRFACDRCGRPLTVKLADLEGPFTCRGCGERIATPVVRCHYPSCGGIYCECDGWIAKLPPEELAVEEAAARAGVETGGGASGAAYDDYGDVRGSIVRYRCSGCGERFTASQGVARHFSDSGRTKCRAIVCNRCHRAPASEELDELE